MADERRQVLATKHLEKAQVRAIMDDILERWAAEQAAKAPAIPAEDLRELADSLGIKLGD
ncbi:hypothetical protein ACIBAI_23745 [Streptomyces sp. NPDC051041]|uniref:hypothetical protein n=1 Tax=Streptomyces sp. NPDC051041 TaxID=3365640 RepID=UPI00379D98D4